MSFTKSIGVFVRSSMLDPDTETQHSDTIYLTATINCLGALLRTRPSTFNKIISAVLNFNPFRQVNGPMSIKSRLQVKSLEKTIRILLLTVIKR